MLRNLINNARQAILEREHPSDGDDKIIISAECERSRVRIHVHNTGSYIPYDIANRLFEYEMPQPWVGPRTAIEQFTAGCIRRLHPADNERP